VLHYALQGPEYELRLALMHDNSRNYEIHALTISNLLVVKAVRPVHNKQHLLTLTQQHFSLSGSPIGAIDSSSRTGAAIGDIHTPGGELRSALEESILGECAVYVAPDFITDAFF
jgi:hypothetical protein